MRYWVFHDQQLASALALREAERQQQGATEQQAKDETQVIVEFLGSAPGKLLRGGRAGE